MTDYKFDFSDEANQTDKELEGDIQNLQGLSQQQIQQLLPNRVDQDKLNEIIAAVNSATSENDKKAAIMHQLHSVSGVVKDVVTRVLKGYV